MCNWPGNSSISTLIPRTRVHIVDGPNGNPPPLIPYLTHATSTPYLNTTRPYNGHLFHMYVPRHLLFPFLSLHIMGDPEGCEPLQGSCPKGKAMDTICLSPSVEDPTDQLPMCELNDTCSWIGAGLCVLATSRLFSFCLAATSRILSMHYCSLMENFNFFSWFFFLVRFVSEFYARCSSLLTQVFGLLPGANPVVSLSA